MSPHVSPTWLNANSELTTAPPCPVGDPRVIAASPTMACRTTRPFNCTYDEEWTHSPYQSPGAGTVAFESNTTGAFVPPETRKVPLTTNDAPGETRTVTPAWIARLAPASTTTSHV